MSLSAPRLLAAAAVAAALAAPAARAASSLDDQARFLAGLPLSAGSPLGTLEATPEWQEHRRTMDAAWGKLASRLTVMDAWAKAELAPRIQPGAKVLYLFGGPDAVTPLWLYPDAPAYLLAGLEPVGQVPPPETLAAKSLDKALSGLAEALRTVAPASFFRTYEMAHDLRGDAIDGVQPIMYLFISRSGAKILAAERLEIDAIGAERVKPEGEPWGAGTRAIRVRFQREGRAPQEMTYVQVDLGDEALAKKPGFLAFTRAYANGAANSLLKAASFILHDNHFKKPRALLVEQSVSVLQDDSGLPFRAFEKGAWEYTAFGTYLAPKPPFQKGFQPDLAKVFAAGARPLPFKIGYRKDAGESNLLLAVRKPVAPRSAAVPAAAEQPGKAN